ncbi:MAG TPA: recombinase [Thermoanaerobacterium sp.]|nr:recombinase [Thermoanaerobacterium sp.]
MAWQRNIPFGYTMKKGEIQCCPTESAAVKEIFRLYLEGIAYSKIADSMMLQGIRYHKHTEKWNKHMVKRILENERYFGEKEYPQIIKLETFMGVQLIKEEKNTYAPCPEYIKPIREKAVCGVCGGRMLRDTKSAGKPRWYCENEDCTNRRYIEDEDVRAALSKGLDSLAQTPHLLDWPIPQNMKELTLEAVRIQNEVVREMNKTEPSTEYSKMLILAYAAEKYSGLPDYMPYYQMQRLKERISGQPIDEELRIEIFRIAVQKIHFIDDSGFRLQLINGQTHETGGKENAECLQTQ